MLQFLPTYNDGINIILSFLPLLMKKKMFVYSNLLNFRKYKIQELIDLLE